MTGPVLQMETTQLTPPPLLVVAIHTGIRIQDIIDYNTGQPPPNFHFSTHMYALQVVGLKPTEASARHASMFDTH